MMAFGVYSQAEVDIAIAGAQTAVSRLTEELKAALLGLRVTETTSTYLKIKDLLHQYDAWTKSRSGFLGSVSFRWNLIERARSFQARAWQFSAELAVITGGESAVVGPPPPPRTPAERYAVYAATGGGALLAGLLVYLVWRVK